MRYWTLMLAIVSAQGAILDRIAVTVGRQVITESDVERDLRVAAFLDRQPVDLSGEQKHKAADRLVDQLLILQEAAFSRIPLPDRADAERLIEPVKKEYGSEFNDALKRYQITETDVVEQLFAGVRALRYTDLRFRPEVQFSDDDLRELYSTLVEQGKKKGEQQIPTFEASREQLEKLLTDQRTTQALDRWLQNQRTETQILYRDEVFK
jgi:parvulin-like peptidyl-prolyl isomerase